MDPTVHNAGNAFGLCDETTEMDWTATRSESSPEPDMMDVDMDDAAAENRLCGETTEMDWTATRSESSPELDMMDVDVDDAADTVATNPQEGDVALSRPGGANHMAPIFDAAFPHGNPRDFLGPGPELVQPSAHVGVHGSWQPTLAHPSTSRAEISFPPAQYEQVAGMRVGQPPGHGSAAPAAVGTGLTSNNVVMPQWPAPAEAGAPTLGMHDIGGGPTTLYGADVWVLRRAIEVLERLRNLKG